MRLLPVLCLAVLLAACGAERPVAVNHPITTEPVMASAEHWQALASDVADRLTMAQPTTLPIAVDMPAATSAFAVNFHEMLITELFKRGFEIADTAPLHVVFDWHVVKHPALKNEISGKEVQAVGAAAGIYGLYRLARDNLVPTAGLALGGVAAGGLIAGSWIADDVDSEVVITTTVKDGPHIVHRQTDIYYLATGEMENFREAKEKGTDHGPTVTYAQRDGAVEGLSDLTRKAEAYCQQQHAHASLARRYVVENVRYNQFACIPDNPEGRLGGGVVEGQPAPLSDLAN